MKFVQLESPFAGEVSRNIRYAQMCMHDCLMRGEAPFASHLLYTQENVLDDDIEEERELGIDAGLEIGKHAELTVVYVDFGVSKGMMYGIRRASELERPVVYRTLPMFRSHFLVDSKVNEVAKEIYVREGLSSVKDVWEKYPQLKGELQGA